jgi:hypothetical protein
MKVRYGEEVANHSGPEPCRGAREGAAEALAGETDRRVLAEFAQEVSTDPYTTKSLSVSDTALAALSSITGLAPEKGGSVASTRAKFEQWWERSKKRLSCSQ